jgi:peptide/nickel transport system substrate-binding protein
MQARRVSTAIALAAAMVVTACSSGSDNDPETGGTTADVQTGGTITVGAAQGIPQLNPAIRTFAWEEVLFPLLWDGLSQTDSSGKIVPDLAESWSASDNQKTWTFKLRDGVTFSNGKELTADDVVKTFDYYRDPDTATQEANKIATIKKVTATDPLTVTVDLSEPNALFPSAIVWVKILDMDSLKTINKEPIGTGPFKVAEFVPSEHLNLVRNDQYWGEAAPLDEIDIVTASDSAAAANSLQSGDLDVLWSVPATDVDQISTDSNIRIVKPAVPSQWPDWEVDTTSAPFDNLKARQALAYAVDRDQVLEAAYFGQGTVSPYNDPLNSENPMFSSEGMTEYTYDLQKAKDLFAEAGVESGDTLTWWGVAGQYPEWNTSAQILQASLKEIGITLKIENNDISTWVDKFYPAGKSFPNMIVPNFQSTPTEPAFSLNYFQPGRCQCNWDNADYQEAYRNAIGEPDEAKRKEYWAQVQTVINQDVPEIVPLQSTVVTAVNAELQNVWVDGGGQLHLEEAGLS